MHFNRSWLPALKRPPSFFPWLSQSAPFGTDLASPVCRITNVHLRQFIHPTSTASQLREVAGTLSSVILTEENRMSFLQLSASVLVAGDSSLWITAGKEIITRSWETDVSFAIELSGSLCELGWGGWKPFGLSSVLKHTQRALETTPTKVLRLLAWLVEEQKLTAVDAIWKQRTERWAEKRLPAANWHGLEEDVSNGYCGRLHGKK